jgi:hypothetical protein
MKIQDIRPGIMHSAKKAEPKGLENFVGREAAGTARAAAEPEREEIGSELNEPCCSVVSFDKCEAGGLTYRQAAALVAELDRCGINGLCIVTDDAAKRYSG